MMMSERPKSPSPTGTVIQEGVRHGDGTIFASLEGLRYDRNVNPYALEAYL
jgi:hypothetical protein